MKRHYLLYCNDLYTITSGNKLSFICYMAVADQFTRTEITYIQVTLSPYLKLRNVVKTYSEYLYIRRQNWVRIPMFLMLKRLAQDKIITNG